MALVPRIVNHDGCCCFCVLEGITATCTPSGGGSCSQASGCAYTLSWSPHDIKDRASWASNVALPADPIRWRCGSLVTFWVPYLIVCGGTSYIADEITVTVTCGTDDPVEYTGTRAVNVVLPESCGCEGCHIDVHVDWVPWAGSPQCGSLVMQVAPGWTLWNDPDSCDECDQAGSENLNFAWGNVEPLIPKVLELIGGSPSAIDGGCGVPDGGVYQCTWFNEVNFYGQEPGIDWPVEVGGQLEFIAGVRFRWCSSTVVITDWHLVSYGEVLVKKWDGTTPSCGDFIGDVSRTQWGNPVSVNLGAAATLADAAFKARNWMVGRSRNVVCNQAGSLCSCHPTADIQCSILA